MTDKPIVTPDRPYSARVEYFACLEDVEAMLAKGYNVRNVYDHMKEQGRFACGYSAFCDYVRGNGRRLHSRKKTSGTKSFSTQPRPAGPKIIRAANDAFPDPRKMDVKDAI